MVPCRETVAIRSLATEMVPATSDAAIGGVSSRNSPAVTPIPPAIRGAEKGPDTSQIRTGDAA